MRILIVDDEPLARSRLQRLLAQLPAYQCIAEAGNAAQAQQLIQELQPDLVLLDIGMPGQDGISLGSDILSLPIPPAVIFITAHPQHALDAYRASPVDYLLKPVSLDRLHQALQKAGLSTRAHAERQATDATICYLQAGIKRQLSLKQIYYFIAEDKYVRMVFAQGEALIEQSLVQLEQQFPEQLVRVHRSTLINKDYLGRYYTSHGKHWIELTVNAIKLEVSRRAIAAIKHCLLQ
ncbi:response regulator transcription factor [Rheinheimera sp. YQF-2]|uniref:Response regulator transcription factor n=1 Tax=Rheinheimera lutimaris TaxID=2740584 RepID=A0A7Y5ANW8_9GAMM|nr:LytTR family DNA-binding domain-containing protein [Rheinheimera lutimaris]NRQ41241.1 response regulator transcription factor [Rheinheimera lutimaris]